MGLGHTRADLRSTAQAKLDDAISLLQLGRYSNAYYLAGYAVEIGLKACIAAQISAETIPDKAFIKGILNHEFKGLVGIAGLAGPLKQRQDDDGEFAANWALASEWSPDVRYESIDPMSAQLLVRAIADPDSEFYNGSKLIGNQWPCSGESVGWAGLNPRLAMWVHNTDTDIWKLG